MRRFRAEQPCPPHIRLFFAAAVTFGAAFVFFRALAVITAGAVFAAMTTVFAALAVVAAGAVFTGAIRIVAFTHDIFSLSNIPLAGISIYIYPLYV